MWAAAAMLVWAIGAYFLFAMFACLAVRHPGETAANQMQQAATCIVLTVAFFALAGWMSS